MDFNYLDLKEVELWEVHKLILKNLKKIQFLSVLQIKDNYIFVIGQFEQAMKIQL